MSDDDFRRYLPTEETMRRVTDRQASEENRRRALENPRLVEAMAEVGAPANGAITPGGGAAAEAPAGGAAEGARVASSPRARARPWTRARVIAGAITSATAPALLVYWLFVVRAPRDAPREDGRVEATAGTPHALPGEAAGAAAPPGATAPAGEAPSTGEAPRSSAEVFPDAMHSAMPPSVTEKNTNSRSAPSAGASVTAAPAIPFDSTAPSVSTARPKAVESAATTTTAVPDVRPPGSKPPPGGRLPEF